MKPDSVVSLSNELFCYFFLSLSSFLFSPIINAVPLAYELVENLPAFLDGSYGTLRILGVSSITLTRRLSM